MAQLSWNILDPLVRFLHSRHKTKRRFACRIRAISASVHLWFIEYDPDEGDWSLSALHNPNVSLPRFLVCDELDGEVGRLCNDTGAALRPLLVPVTLDPDSITWFQIRHHHEPNVMHQPL